MFFTFVSMSMNLQLLSSTSTHAQIDQMGSGTAATPIAVGGTSSSEEKWFLCSKFLALQIKANGEAEQDEAHNLQHFAPQLYKAHYWQFHTSWPEFFTPALEQRICAMIKKMASLGTFHNSLQMVMENCSCKTHRHAPPPSTWSDAWYTDARFAVALRPIPKHRYVIVVILRLWVNVGRTDSCNQRNGPSALPGCLLQRPLLTFFFTQQLAYFYDSLGGCR